MRRAVLCLVLVAGCASSGLPDDGRVQVVTGAYPFAWVAEQVGGPDVTVTDLVPPGAEPHELEAREMELPPEPEAADASPPVLTEENEEEQAPLFRGE